MKIKAQKIFVFDVGNTLVDKPSNRMVSTLVDDLSALRERGNIIGVATMRNLAMLSELLTQVNFDFIIALNGAYVACGNKTLIDNPIDSTNLAQIIKTLDDKKTKYKLYTKHNIQTSTEQIENVYGIELEDCSDVVDDLKAYFPSLVFHVWEKGKTCDIHSIHVSKSKGMKEVCSYFDIPIVNSIAFGDGFNDVELFKLCGISVAMETAPDELKLIASYITKSVQANGISWALKHFKL